SSLHHSLSLYLHDALPISRRLSDSAIRWRARSSPAFGTGSIVGPGANLPSDRRSRRSEPPRRDALDVERDHLIELVVLVLLVLRSEEHTSELQSPDHLVCR